MTGLFNTVPKPKRRSTLNKVGAWLAILAILVQGLMPVGSALASSWDDGATEILVCTANGIQSISLDANGAPIEPRALGTCPFCTLHVTAIPAEQNFDTSKVLFARQAATVFSSPVHQSTTNIWRATPAPSRAPPSLS